MNTQSVLVRALHRVEHAGNRLPHPTALFVWFAIAILFLSWLLHLSGLSASHPSTNELITVNNLLSAAGLHKILSHTVTNFTQFAPLGTVLVAMLGLGIAEKSGLLGAVLARLVSRASGKSLTMIVVFSGVLSSLAADAGYVVLIPLAGIVFASAGKHPIAGMAAAFAGVSGGYSANLLAGPIDVVLSGISTEAVQLIHPEQSVSVLANYYFIACSTLLIVFIGTWITHAITLPALPEWAPESSDSNTTGSLLANEQKALRYAGLTFITTILIILLALLPENGVLRHPETGSIIQSPFISGIVSLISLIAALCGIVYGYFTQRYHVKGSIIQDMETTFSTMAGYLVLMFFAAQFVNYFGWSNIGLILAVKGADLLGSLNLSTAMILLMFILFSALINLLVGSASAKWSILAPVFIPMFLLIGIAPEQVQAAYRVGDSSTNIITPLMPYFGVVVAFMQRYNPQLGIGTIMSLMLPYSLALLVGWSVLLTLWVWFQIPLGPLI